MLYSVADMLAAVGNKLGGPGVDPTCEPGRTLALKGLNRATRLLMTEEKCIVDGYVHLPVTGGTITLDRRISHITSAKVQGHDQMPVFGQSARFLDGVDFDRCEGNECRPESLEFIGNRFAVHRELDKPRIIFAVSDRPEAADAKLVVIGYDDKGAEIRTVAPSMVKGIATPITYATCDTAPTFTCGDDYYRGLVASITMLRKPRTNGYVSVWGLDEYTGDVYWLTTLAPDETSPSQTRYRIRGWDSSITSIFAHVVLQFAPMYDDNDISLIQQPDALEDMTQALAFKDRNDYGGFQTYRNAALALLRKDRKAQSGTDHRLNVRVAKMPLRGRNFGMR